MGGPCGEWAPGRRGTVLPAWLLYLELQNAGLRGTLGGIGDGRSALPLLPGLGLIQQLAVRIALAGDTFEAVGRPHEH